MTITQAIDRLFKLREQHGDIQVYADCPKCGESFVCGLVVIGPETARLSAAVDPPAQPSGTPGPRGEKSS